MRNRLMTTGRIISVGGRGCTMVLLGLLLLGCGSDNGTAPVVGGPEITPAQHTLTFYNMCKETIWVGMAGNALPGGGFFESGGWEMPSDPNGTSPYTFKITQGWQGRFWPRTGCATQYSPCPLVFCQTDSDCQAQGQQTCNIQNPSEAERKPDNYCRSDSDCDTYWKCDLTTTGFDKPPPPKDECTTDDDCPDNKVCVYDDPTSPARVKMCGFHQCYAYKCEDPANCNPQFICDTGGCKGADTVTFQLVCGPGQGGLAPASLFEFSFDAAGGPKVGPYDTYDMSLVDGFNMPVQIKPKDGTYNTTPDPGQDANFWCQVKGCQENPSCPDSLIYKDNKSCLGPCMKATNDLGYSGDDKARICCDNSNITPTCDTGCADNCYIGGFGCSPFGPGDDNEKCYATTSGKHGYWGDDTLIGADALLYIDNVKAVCPTVYSWQFRDKDSTFICRKTGGIVDYEITFCPSDSSRNN